MKVNLKYKSKENILLPTLFSLLIVGNAKELCVFWYLIILSCLLNIVSFYNWNVDLINW